MGKAILVVLDSLGIGGAPDAEQFGDKGANTLGNIISKCSREEANIGRSGPLRIPNLEALGIMNALKVPSDLRERIVICVDPMLATGNSAVEAIKLLKESGAKNIRFLCLLAAPEGIKNLEEHHPDVPIVTASLDRQLNAIGYILPGLGDAGDRMYGTK